MDTEYAIIGAGIIGSSLSYRLSEMGSEVVVIDKEGSPGLHASGRTSGVLHSGMTLPPGTLKAMLCVEGNALVRAYCEEHAVPIRTCGTLLIAKDEEESPTLDTLLGMGTALGVPGLRIITKDELFEKEPYVGGTRALFAPTGSVVDSIAFLESIVREAQEHGATFLYNTEVRRIGNAVETDNGKITAKHIINAAGLHADTLAHSAGVGTEYRIIPFRGDYYTIRDAHLHSMVYQVPDFSFPFKGMHIARTTDGTVIAGPTATLSFGREAYDKELDYHDTISMISSIQFWHLIAHQKFRKLAKENLRKSFSKTAFTNEIRKMYPSVRQENLIPYRSGIRAQLVNREGELCQDIVIISKDNQFHILNAVSPGLTSSLAFARYLADLVGKK